MSAWFTTIQTYYNNGLYTVSDLDTLVIGGLITEEERDKIVEKQ